MLLLLGSRTARPGGSLRPWEAPAPTAYGWIVPATLTGLLSQSITPPLIVVVNNLQNTFCWQRRVTQGRKAVAGII